MKLELTLIFAQICTPMSNDIVCLCGFLCKLSTYNQEVVALNVHVGDEIAHANKTAADNI